MSVKKTRIEINSAESRLNILNSAKQLFASKGFVASSIREIAKNAGVSEGLIYHHFADKTALLTGIVDDLTGPEGLINTHLRAVPVPDSLEEYLGNFFTMVQSGFSSDNRIMTVFRIMLNSIPALSQNDRNRIILKINGEFWMAEAERLKPLLKKSGLDSYYFVRFMHGSLIGYFLFQEVFGAKEVIDMDSNKYKKMFIKILSESAGSSAGGTNEKSVIKRKKV
jgi:AcrR family transcriptional regulator